MKRSHKIFTVIGSSALCVSALVGIGHNFASEESWGDNLYPPVESVTDPVIVYGESDPLEFSPSEYDSALFEELVSRCAHDYSDNDQWYEDCVDTVLTLTCQFVPFSPDSEWFSPADARCLELD